MSHKNANYRTVSVLELLLEFGARAAQLAQPSSGNQRQLTKAASAVSMNAAALLDIKAELGKLRHKGALTTEQFQLLKARTKDGTVT